MIIKEPLKHDGLLNIATGRDRKETNWKNTEMLWSNLIIKLSVPHRTAETYAAYIQSKKTRQDEIKDVGGFVGGHISGGRRKKTNILNRSLVTLDIDFGTKDVFNDFVMLYNSACCIYTTHKNGPGAFRGRLVIPLNREVFKDEYAAVSRKIAGALGIEQFDDTTYDPARLMYWPSASKDGAFDFEYYDGPFLNADEILNSYHDWRDINEWPVSHRTDKAIRLSVKKQENPLEKPGLIGAFCRCYSIREAIEEFLPEVYEICGNGRYTYKEGSTTGGVVIYDDKFCYSHHGTDPAGTMLCNAFDIVRIHKFGLKDEDAEERTPVNRLPSFNAMNEFISKLPKVVRLAVTERTREAGEVFKCAELENIIEEDGSWAEKLEVDKRGNIKNSLRNLILILENDNSLKNIVFNQLSDSIEIKGGVPWNNRGKWWRDADDAQLVSYIDALYTNFTGKNYETALTKVTDDRAYHPIINYLDTLPVWDGVKRVDTLFIDYLGARDTDYIRAVTRKTLCAAIARIKDPGCKFDSVPILEGPQEIGKSTMIEKLAMEWFSDSLQISDIRDKTAAEKLQGYWILEIAELAGIRKADEETLKAFLSRRNDIYRASFGRRVTPHLRQCVFIGTTNAENGYLRDITGNRRFWPVKVTGACEKKPWDITESDVHQIWSEAYQLYQSGETLHLEGELSKQAEREQREAMESDEKEGMVRDYLDRLLPENWSGMSLSERRLFLDSSLGSETGTVKRRRVCPQEIWAECYGKNPSDLKNRDAYAINKIIAKFPDWEKIEYPVRFPIYGNCRGHRRKI